MKWTTKPSRKFLNEKLWKSAYLIEFFKDGTLQDAFTFSVPPQNEEFVYPQRVSETKTFGGTVIDDYGNDSCKITLSGTTINQELKLIYRGIKGFKQLNGQDEIFYLKELLQKYGKYTNLSGKEVRLYALTSGRKNKGGKNQKSWRIFVNELQIKRSKDMPFTYFYTLNCIGVPIESFVKPQILEAAIKTVNDAFNSFYGILDGALETASQYLSYIDEFSELVSVINNNVERVGEYIDSFTGLATGAIDKVTNVVDETVSLHNTVLSTALRLHPKSVAISLYNATADLFSSCKDLKDWWGEFANGDNPEYKKMCSNYDESEQQLRDIFTKTFCEVYTSSAGLMASVEKNTGTGAQQAITLPGNGAESDSIIIAKGYQEYTYTSGDTWATISQNFYNTPALATMLQLYNSDISLDSMSPGDTIYIPNISANASNILMANEIYIEPTVNDIYGKDVKITKEGDIAFTQTADGDFVLVSGIGNLNQAILARLSTSINSRVRNVVYGIRNETGSASVDSAAIASYITSSIEETILADPRVDSIEELTWSGGRGETINVTVVYKTTTGNINTYIGKV